MSLTYKNAVRDAISALNTRGGVSRQAIKAYLKNKFKLKGGDKFINYQIRNALKTGTEEGLFVHITGGKDRFKLGKKPSPKKAKKAPARKKKAASKKRVKSAPAKKKSSKKKGQKRAPSAAPKSRMTKAEYEKFCKKNGIKVTGKLAALQKRKNEFENALKTKTGKLTGYSNYHTTALQKICKKRNLPTTGSKAALWTRVTEKKPSPKRKTSPKKSSKSKSRGRSKPKGSKKSSKSKSRGRSKSKGSKKSSKSKSRSRSKSKGSKKSSEKKKKVHFAMTDAEAKRWIKKQKKTNERAFYLREGTSDKVWFVDTKKKTKKQGDNVIHVRYGRIGKEMKATTNKKTVTAAVFEKLGKGYTELE